MVTVKSSILRQMKETADELAILKARGHGCARAKRRRLRKQAAELEGRLCLLVTDLLEAQRSERNAS